MKSRIVGFTLIELLVVVLVIGILATVAIPQYEVAVEKSHMAEGITLVRSIADAEQVYFLQNGEYSSDIRKLDYDFPGQIVTYYIPGFQTEYWTCRSAFKDLSTISSGWKEALSVCNRNPKETFYSIGKLKDGRLVCYGYSEKGKNFCKKMGTQQIRLTNSVADAYLLTY